MPVDWSLARMPDVGKSFLDAFEQGRQQRREAESRNALNALFASSTGQQAPSPDNQAQPDTRQVNFAALTPEDMRTAIAIQQAQREQAKAQREHDFSRAAASYAGGNALLSMVGPSAPAQGQSVNALAPQSMKVPGSFAPTLPDQPRQQEPQNPTFAVLGQPRTDSDRAFLRMLEIDPARAVKLKSDLRDNFVKMVGQEHDMYAEAVDRLALATDETSYQRVIAEFAPRMAALGGDLSQMVPPNYPGPDGIRELTMRALSAKDRLSAFIAQSRAETYANDVKADNIRQDRNTESLITDRNQRRNDQRNYNEGRLGIARDRAETYRQNVNRPGGGGRSSGGGRAAAPVKVNTPAEAMKLPKGTRYTTPDGRVMVR